MNTSRPILFPKNKLAHFPVLLLLLCGCLPASAQKLSGFEIDRGWQMLGDINADVKKSYFDPTFRGVDIEARYKEADEQIKHATSLGQMFAAIATRQKD